MTVAELIAQKNSLPSEQIVLRGYLAIRGRAFEARVYAKEDGPYSSDSVFVTVSDENVERAVSGEVPPYGGGSHTYFDEAELRGFAARVDSGICLSGVTSVVIFRTEKDWHVEIASTNAA